MDDMKEIMEDFLIEAFELIEQIDHDLVELEANPEDLELLNRIFRFNRAYSPHGGCFKQS